MSQARLTYVVHQPAAASARGQRESASRPWLALALAASTLSLALPLDALAQIEEIVVTARKKEENLKDVPVAIEAVTAEDIQRKGIVDIAHLAEQSARDSDPWQRVSHRQGSARLRGRCRRAAAAG